MKRFFSFLLLAVIVFFSCAYNLTLSEADLNSKLKQVFPVEKEVYLTTVRLENPSLKLLEGNRGEVLFDLTVKPPIGRKLKGKVDAIGKFQFDPETKTLYLVDLETKDVTVNGKTFLSDKTGRLISTLFKGVLKRIPVYRFEGEKARFIKGISTERGKVIVKLGV